MPRSLRPGHASRRTAWGPGAAGRQVPQALAHPAPPDALGACQLLGMEWQACVSVCFGAGGWLWQAVWEAREHLPLRVWGQTLVAGASVILRRALGAGHRLWRQSKARPHPPRSGAGDGGSSPGSRGEGKALAASMSLPRGLGSAISSLRNPSHFLAYMALSNFNDSSSRKPS